MLGSMLGTVTRVLNTPATLVDSVMSDRDADKLQKEDRFVSAPFEELAKAFDGADRKDK